MQQPLGLFADEKKLKETQKKLREDLQAKQKKAKTEEEERAKFLPRHDPHKTAQVVKVINESINKVNYEFMNWLDVCLAAVEGREDDYMQLIHDMPRKKLDDYANALSAMQSFFLDGYYDDVLGTFYQQHYKSNNGYYITPFHISLMMAKMLDIKLDEKLNEPCCGSGSMLLAAKYVIHEKHGWMASCFYATRNLSGQDIGLVQVKMCKLQLHLCNYLHMIDRITTSIRIANEKAKEAECSAAAIEPKGIRDSYSEHKGQPIPA